MDWEKKALEKIVELLIKGLIEQQSNSEKFKEIGIEYIKEPIITRVIRGSIDDWGYLLYDAIVKKKPIDVCVDSYLKQLEETHSK